LQGVKSLGFVRLEIPCPGCGKASLQLLRDAVENDVFTCPSCGKAIDLTTPEWRSFLDHAAEFYGAINESAKAPSKADEQA
jgi:transcription elongation factor Elf1